MANVCNLFMQYADHLDTSDPNVLGNGQSSTGYPNCSAFWRKTFPQPFNVTGVAGGGRPLTGQMWPRGNV